MLKYKIVNGQLVLVLGKIKNTKMISLECTFSLVSTNSNLEELYLNHVSWTKTVGNRALSIITKRFLTNTFEISLLGHFFIFSILVMAESLCDMFD